jgi:hypothetical protein
MSIKEYKNERLDLDRLYQVPSIRGADDTNSRYTLHAASCTISVFVRFFVFFCFFFFNNYWTTHQRRRRGYFYGVALTLSNFLGRTLMRTHLHATIAQEVLPKDRWQLSKVGHLGFNFWRLLLCEILTREL